MIYLVSRNQRLFSPNKYRQVEFSEALSVLLPLRVCQLDTETMGLDCHTKELLTVQLGCSDNQVVFDWTTLSNSERTQLKEYLESDRLFLGHNLMFDLTFLYKQDIWPKHIYDTMIAEQLIFLGCPRVITASLWNDLSLTLPGYDYINPRDNGEDKDPYYELSYSLQATARRRLGVNIDKTVRGRIINDGLTEDVVVYAAGDVMWLEKIVDSQKEKLERQELTNAVKFECEFIKFLAYVKYCGVHLDQQKWKAKMEKDLQELKAAEKDLDDWVINYDKNSKYTKVDLQGDLWSGFNTRPKCTINWSSSKQVIPLFEELGIQVVTFDKRTKKKRKSVEEKLLAPQADKFSIIPLYLRYQGASKLVSTYGQNWLNAINPVTNRIHVELHSIGTDTSRVSSGGGPYKLNQQNLPKDAETRACFTAEKGNKWISIDYSGQESRIIASVSKDQAMIDLFENKGGDIHSLVAYMSYPEVIPRDTDLHDIKKKYHQYRQEAKGIEFAINYGGDANTIANNKGIPLSEATEVYNNFMKGFPGVKTYQDYCRRAVMQKGYILMNNILKHRAHIYDAEWLLRMQEKFKDPDFWSYYNEMKRDAPSCDTVQSVKRFFKRKAESEKQSINYRIQNRGACAFKLASIKFFNWIVSNNYQNIIKVCIVAHDEINCEAPDDIAMMVADTLTKCMIAGGKPFCPNVYLGADLALDENGNLPNYWIHE